MSLEDYIATIPAEDVVAIWYSIHSVWISTKTNPRPFVINCEYSSEAIARTVLDFKRRWPGKPVVRMKHYTERN